MTLSDRLNRIIQEQNITKAAFARRLGISENYVYILTGNSRSGSGQNKQISRALAKLIAIEFGYDPQWVLYGEKIPDKMNGYQISVVSVFERFFSAAEVIGTFSVGRKEVAAIRMIVPAPGSDQFRLHGFTSL